MHLTAGPPWKPPSKHLRARHLPTNSRFFIRRAPPAPFQTKRRPGRITAGEAEGPRSATAWPLLTPRTSASVREYGPLVMPAPPVGRMNGAVRRPDLEKGPLPVEFCGAIRETHHTPIQHDRTTRGSATSCCDRLVAGSQLRESGNPRSSLARSEFGFPRHQFHLCFIAGLHKGVRGQILRLGRSLHLHWTGFVHHRSKDDS
jgi:hypothetical protein